MDESLFRGGSRRQFSKAFKMRPSAGARHRRNFSNVCLSTSYLALLRSELLTISIGTPCSSSNHPNEMASGRSRRSFQNQRHP